MAGRPLPTAGLPGPSVARGTVLRKGVRYSLPPGACVLDPLGLPFHGNEQSCLKTVQISKMKGQGLVCAQTAAKLIVVNLRFIVYAKKEGTLRILHQSGKGMFELHNTTRAVFTDMAINGVGGNTPVGEKTTVLCVDEAAHVSIFILEAYGIPSNTEVCNTADMTKKIDIVFPQSMDPPLRILGNPGDTQSFVTMHANHLGVWSLLALELHDPKEGPGASKRRRVTRWGNESGAQQDLGTRGTGFITHEVDEELMANSSQQLILPGASSVQGSPRLRDAAVSGDAKCLVALAADAVFVWRLGDPSGRGTPELLQHLSLAPHIANGPSLHSVSILGGSQDVAEALVLGSGIACELFAYELLPSSSTPVGPLLQSLSLTTSNGDALIGCIDVNTTRETLGIAFRNRKLLLVLPLAKGWSGSPGLPFPYAQRFATEEPAYQQSTLTAKSFRNAGQTLFMYRAYNFTRKKDSLLGCNIVVSELQDPALAAREEGPVCEEAAGDDAAAAPATAPPDADPQAATVDVETAPAANGFPEAAEEEQGSEASGHEPAPKDGSNPLSGPEEAAPRPAPAFDFEGADWSVAPANTPDRELQAAPAQPSVVADPVTNGAYAADTTGDEDGDANVAVENSAAADLSGTGAQALDGPSGHHRPADRQPNRPDLDWGFVKHAASFAKGIDVRKGEMADRVLKEVSEAAKSAAGVTAEQDLAVLEQALAGVGEAREVQTTCERNLQSAAKRTSESWAEASTTAVANLLQKELGKISDSVAATLANQLSQSKKFCEALAHGVQKSGSAVTKHALEALRPPRQMQETVGVALSEALHESLAPVFKAELRQYFEKELAPLIGQRVGDMMVSFRERIGKCFEGIAAEHELAGQRLGRDLAPIVAEELRHVESVLSQHRPPPGDALTDAQLDELAQAVQAEVVQPLHARIQDLSAQVQVLREESRRLEERWVAAQRAQAAAAALAGSAGPAEREEAQARELESLFREGKVSNAFINAMNLQEQEGTRCDFLDRVCALVPENLEEWLVGDGGDGPLGMQVKMFLMLALTRQLEDSKLPEQTRASKIEWITELWFVFDPAEPKVVCNAPCFVAQLSEALDRIEPGECSESTSHLRRLKKAVRQCAKVLRDI